MRTGLGSNLDSTGSSALRSERPSFPAPPWAYVLARAILSVAVVDHHSLEMCPSHRPIHQRSKRRWHCRSLPPGQIQRWRFRLWKNRRWSPISPTIMSKAWMVGRIIPSPARSTLSSWSGADAMMANWGSILGISTPVISSATAVADHASCHVQWRSRVRRPLAGIGGLHGPC